MGSITTTDFTEYMNSGGLVLEKIYRFFEKSEGIGVSSL